MQDFFSFSLKKAGIAGDLPGKQHRGPWHLISFLQADLAESTAAATIQSGLGP